MNSSKIINFNNKSSQILKGIAIILVVVGHLSKAYPCIPYNLRFGGAWGVCIFLVLSGFGLVQSNEKNSVNGCILTKRLLKVWFPYVIVTGLWIIIDKIVFQQTHATKTVVLSFLGINSKNAIDTSMWFITFILIWYIIFYFIFKISCNKILNVIVLFCFSILFYKLKNLQPLSAPYIFDFPIGVCLGIFWNKIKDKLGERSIIIITIVCTFIFSIVYSRMEQGQIYYLLADFSFAFGAISLAILIELKNLSMKLKSISFIGGISFEIYLLEGVILFRYNMIHLFKNSIISVVFALLTVLILGVLLKRLILILNKHLSIKNNIIQISKS